MKYWDEYYLAGRAPQSPSPFFEWFHNNYCLPKSRVLEIGCGNGRDSFAFHRKGFDVLATDGSLEAINYCKDQAISTLNNSRKNHLEFKNIELETILINDVVKSIMDFSPDIVYSRFLLHAVTKPVERKIMTLFEKHMKIGTILAHEFRTDKDPLKQQGIRISASERMTDHYRRFINPEEILSEFKQIGYNIEYFKESRGLAPYNNEDPIVARIVARKVH